MTDKTEIIKLKQWVFEQESFYPKLTPSQFKHLLYLIEVQFKEGIKLVEEKVRNILIRKRQTFLHDLEIEGLSESYQKELSLKIDIINQIERELQSKSAGERLI